MPPDYSGIPDPSILGEISHQPSTIETVDRAMFEFLENKMDIFATSNKGWKKVPVIWVSAERAFQIKRKKELRDQKGALILPMLTIERSSVIKGSKRGKYLHNPFPESSDAHHQTITIAKKIKQDKTANYANADSYKRNRQLNSRTWKKNEKVVYQVLSMPIPIYLDITYKVSVRAEYQQQMNEIITPFWSMPGSINNFLINKDGHKYEAFVAEDFTQNNNAATLGEQERIYETSFNVNVLGYIQGSDKNSKRPKITVSESAVEVKIPRERVMMGDIPDLVDEKGFYRE